jgi:hypothetical protein
MNIKVSEICKIRNNTFEKRVPKFGVGQNVNFFIALKYWVIRTICRLLIPFICLLSGKIFPLHTMLGLQ